MSPNLFLLANPRNWFRRQQSSSTVGKPQRRTEHWDKPEPGTYEYTPGRGWYLIAPDDSSCTVPLPAPVTYSKALKKYLFKDDYVSRQRHRQSVEVSDTEDGIALEKYPGKESASSSRSHSRNRDSPKRKTSLGFLRLDDGITWIACWDEDGQFIPGPYQKWVIDPVTQRFRKMVKADDPGYWSKRGSMISAARSETSSRRSPGGATGSSSVARSAKSATPSMTAPESRPSSRGEAVRPEPENSVARRGPI